MKPDPIRELPHFSYLPGEDVNTEDLTEVAGWIAVYEELARVVRSVLVRKADEDHAEQLQKDLVWIEERLAEWRDRHAALAGVVIDRKAHTITYSGKALRLTRREAELLDFMLRHPGRPFTTRMLATLAWQNSRLSDAQVRTYIMRLRNRLREVDLEHMLTVTRNQGYGAEASV